MRVRLVPLFYPCCAGLLAAQKASKLSWQSCKMRWKDMSGSNLRGTTSNKTQQQLTSRFYTERRNEVIWPKKLSHWWNKIDSQYRVNLTQIFSNNSEFRVEFYFNQWLNFLGQNGFISSFSVLKKCFCSNLSIGVFGSNLLTLLELSGYSNHSCL